MYHALIRTHHITSRKKVATLKAAAKKHGCLALLRSGGTPGIMYVRSEEEERVKKWVEVVHVSVPIFTSLVDFLLRRGLKELGDWVLLRFLCGSCFSGASPLVKLGSLLLIRSLLTLSVKTWKGRECVGHDI